ncbi:MAG: holin family protein [Paracoccaceae bacterium]|jgi:hypothetical protein|nr:holin family protein [Paracoccaceae bacterium]
MGLISRLFAPTGMQAAGNAARGLAEVFVPNATRKLELAALGTTEARDQFIAEFVPRHPSGWFDEIVNGLNRLPRPALALGTLSLFFYAMVDPTGFGVRMQGLALVPEPLWWLLGAIVSFYFGAREAHYIRQRNGPAQNGPGPFLGDQHTVAGGDENLALRDWRAQS